MEFSVSKSPLRNELTRLSSGFVINTTDVCDVYHYFDSPQTVVILNAYQIRLRNWA